jgi:hypothetical protein
MNPVPVMVTVVAPAPAVIESGLMALIAGDGLSTSRFRAGVLLLETVPLFTTTGSSAPTVDWLAGTVAFSSVELSNTVCSLAPPT